MEKKNDANHNTNTLKANAEQKLIPNLSSLPGFILEWIENNTSEVISVWNEDGRGLFFSKSIKTILGYDPMDLAGISWSDFVSGEDAAYIGKYFEPEQIGQTQIFNVHIKNNAEKLIWCECNLAKLKDTLSKEVYIIVLIKDITDRKEVEEMMIRSEKMSIAGQLAAGIAHEIRNPLTALKGFLQLLKAGVNRKEVYYKIMIDEIEKIETITSELLFISKPLTNQKRKESFSEMIDDVIELLKPQARLKNIMIESEKTNAEIVCDRSQIKQVLINIVKNAIEAMDTPGTIKIRTFAEFDHFIVDIIDEGPGIDEKIIHKLDEPFFTTKQTGTGLGLMITRQILERHNAYMKIMQNEEKGSTFRLVFRLEK